MPARRLSILSVAFPFAPVGQDAVGGAEQILTQLDAGLVDAGHMSIVIGTEGSAVRGALVTVPRMAERDAVHAATRDAIRRVLANYPVDLVHFHGVDFDQYLPAFGPPALVTLHLPHFSYTGSVFELRRPRTFFQPVSCTQWAGLPPARLPILDPIENGVPLEKLPLCEHKEGFVLALGRICPEKGFHLAARAARIAGVPFLLGGRIFPYATHEAYFCEVLAPLLDENWFQFLGPLVLERKRDLLARARCLLVPSQISETSSLAAMEAAACGTPVIAFRAGALAEVVEHGRSGFLVDSVEEMAEAIGKADEVDPRECRRVAETRFSAERMTARYLERYAEIVERTVPVEPPLVITGITSLVRLDDVRAEWTDLWQRCGGSIFQHPDWLIPWCGPFHVREPWLLAFRRGRRLVGVAPLLVYPRGHEQVLTLMGAGISDDQDVLIEPAEQAAVMRGLWHYLMEHADRFDCFELENLRARSPLLQPVPGAWCSESVERQDVRPVLRLPERLQDVDAPDVLRDVRYQTRRAEREGIPIRVETATPDSFHRLFDELVRLHRARWEDEGMLGAELESFHRAAAQRLMETGLLRLHVLSLGGETAAAFYGYHAAKRTVYYLGGFEPSLARFSPGKLVVAYAIEHAITQDRARLFDFLRGAESYKYAWGAVDQPLYRRRLSAAVAREQREGVVHAA